jgi:hypothetical protein
MSEPLELHTKLHIMLYVDLERVTRSTLFVYDETIPCVHEYALIMDIDESAILQVCLCSPLRPHSVSTSTAARCAALLLQSTQEKTKPTKSTLSSWAWESQVANLRRLYQGYFWGFTQCGGVVRVWAHFVKWEG